MGVTGCDTTTVCVVCGRCTEHRARVLARQSPRGVIWSKALGRASPGDFQYLASAPASSSHPFASRAKELCHIALPHRKVLKQ